MPTGSLRSSSVVLVSGDRAAVRRFAVRRAATSAMLAVALLLAWGTGLAGSVSFGLVFGVVTYLGFTARGTRGLARADQGARSGT